MNTKGRKEKMVCANHFLDENLKIFIQTNGKKEKCDYCEKARICTDVLTLADHIEECIHFEYDDPYSQGASYNKEAVYYEDRFPGVRVTETINLLEEEVDLEDGTDWDILDDLRYSFENNYWSEIDGIWGATKAQYMYGGWDLFKEIIKHKVRYIFFNSSLGDEFDENSGEAMNPHEILEAVKGGVVELNLFKKFSRGELKVYRGRQHNAGEKIISADQIGSPPPKFAKANRMSAAGISMFYGAFEEKTCFKEIENLAWVDSEITTGKFINLTDLNLIDFTKMEFPSLFDPTNRAKRSVAKFLASFIKDMSTPVKPDDSVHIDYVPTQVVTEYFKYMFPNEDKVNGIMYNSVKNDGGKCVVIFSENRDMADDTPKKISSKVKNFFGEDAETTGPEVGMLMLLSKTVKTTKIIST